MTLKGYCPRTTHFKLDRGSHNPQTLICSILVCISPILLHSQGSSSVISSRRPLSWQTLLLHSSTQSLFHILSLEAYSIILNLDATFHITSKLIIHMLSASKSLSKSCTLSWQPSSRKPIVKTSLICIEYGYNSLQPLHYLQLLTQNNAHSHHSHTFHIQIYFKPQSLTIKILFLIHHNT